MVAKFEETLLNPPRGDNDQGAIPAEMVRACAGQHARLCPRQVLGLRIGLLGGEILGLDIPRTDKRLFTLAETDGCAVDGLSAATGCTVGHRTLRVIDFGKVAATIVDVKTGEAIRIAPRPDIRLTASRLFPKAKSRWHAQLDAYRVMQAADLLSTQPVQLNHSIEELIGRPGDMVICTECGEEIINRREMVIDGRLLCQACAGHRYYVPLLD
jgi:formylmethanofuran dehydrogenase subunit E